MGVEDKMGQHMGNLVGLEQQATSMRVRGLILDRDGVLLRLVGTERRSPRTAEEVRVVDDVPDFLDWVGLERLKCVVATNQPEVRRGLVSRDFVEETNSLLLGRYQVLEAFYVCWHDDGDNCACRKPQPGLMLSALQNMGLQAPEVVVVGDRWKDVKAAHAAGCRSLLVGGSDGLAPSPSGEVAIEPEPDWVAGCLSEVPRILSPFVGPADEPAHPGTP